MKTTPPTVSASGLVRATTSVGSRLGVYLLQGIAYVVVVLYCASSLGVLVWTLYSSFKSDADMYMGAWSLPSTWHWEYYIQAWDDRLIGKYFFNSAWIVPIQVVGQVLISAMAAYALARIAVRWNRLILYFFLAAFMVPGFYLFIPTYMVVGGLGLRGSPLALFALAWSGVSWNIFILTGFFRTLPKELEESAAVDGSSAWSTFWRIMLPLASPGLLTVSIFSFIGLWNDFFTVMVYVANERWYTLPVALLFLRMNQIQYFGILFAALIIALIPTVIVFALLQERITEGLTLGALKG